MKMIKLFCVFLVLVVILVGVVKVDVDFDVKSFVVMFEKVVYYVVDDGWLMVWMIIVDS